MLREGSAVAILSFGARLKECLRAADHLAVKGLTATVVDARFAKPLDEDLIRQLVAHHEALITIEEGAMGGFGPQVLHFLARDGLLDRGLKVRTLTMPDAFVEHDKPAAMYEAAGLDASGVVRTALTMLGWEQKASEGPVWRVMRAGGAESCSGRRVAGMWVAHILAAAGVGGDAPGWRGACWSRVSISESSQSPVASTVGDSRVAVVRIDPARFVLDLYSANTLKLPQPLPIDYGRRVNISPQASMQACSSPAAGLRVMRGWRRHDQSRLESDYGAVLALGPDDPKLPAAAILDPDCDDVKAMEKHYRVMLQSMRMIDCKGANRWTKSARIWSTAALGIDDQGRVLFIHARSPWDVHDFNEILLALPIGLRRVMYLEGGPEASLMVDAGGFSTVRVGSWETGFREDDTNNEAWPLPNVIGVRRIGGGAMSGTMPALSVFLARLRARRGINASDGAGFLFVRQARKGAHIRDM